MGRISKFTIILLRLPNGELVLQRRTKNAQYGPGKLGLFGGWMEDGETPEECIVRELKEETSLPVDKLAITPVKDFIVPKGGDFKENRHFYLFSTAISDAAFEVYEGDGAEVFTVEELRERDDLTGSSYFVFHSVL